MDPRFRTALWALAGLALAVGISMAAFAVAGGSISEPAGTVRVIPTADEQMPEHTPRPSRSAKPSRSDEPPTSTATSTATSTSSSATSSPSDDHSGSGEGGESHDGSDD